MEPVDQVKKLVPYVPGKPIEEVEREYGIEKPAKLASNENPLGPSKLAIKALEETADQVHLYPDGDCFYLKKKIASFLNVKEGNLTIGNGSNDVLELIARTYLSKGDEAIYGQHAFIVYPIAVQSVGARHVISPMPHLVHDLKDVASRVTGKTKIIFLANPNNPTGTIFSKADFEEFLTAVPSSVLIVVDEAYFEYVDEEHYPDTLQYHGKAPNLITIRTFSKVYGLAGLRVGYAVASENITGYINRVRQPFNVNSLAQVAALAAMDDGDHLLETREVNKAGMEFLEKGFSGLGIEFIKSYANFILIDLRQDPMPTYHKLLEDGVIVRPVGNYGLKTHLRVTIGTEKENRKLLRSLKKVLGK